ncbi:hypothetical protein ABZ175_35320, partial [Streptomyces cyaneofuscatus]
MSDVGGPSVLMLAVRVHQEEAGASVRRHTAAHRGGDLARYEALLSAVPQVVWRMTAQGDVFTLVGRLGETGGGLWNPERSGLSWMDAIHPKDRDWFRARWAATARGDALLDAVVRIRQEGDPVRYRHMKALSVPVLKDGEVVEWIGAVADAEDQWQIRTRNRLLERVSAVSFTQDLPEVFATTAAAVVPDLVEAPYSPTAFHRRSRSAVISPSALWPGQRSTPAAHNCSRWGGARAGGPRGGGGPAGGRRARAGGGGGARE